MDEIRVGFESSSVNNPRIIAGISLSWFRLRPVKSTPRRKTVDSVSEMFSVFEDFLEDAMDAMTERGQERAARMFADGEAIY